ncbi:MAG: hypothetical protein QQW96_25370 [Tychonema bourrellyi B0820]|nr:hypothetical protein [Tychonema bourrellyi B0820]
MNAAKTQISTNAVVLGIVLGAAPGKGLLVRSTDRCDRQFNNKLLCI